MRDKTRTAKEAIAELGTPVPKWVYMSRDEIIALITALGGLSKAAKYFDVQPCTVTKWKNTGRIPGWAHYLYSELQRAHKPSV